MPAPWRRMATGALAAAAALGVAAVDPAPGDPPSSRPNVIVVLTDDQHWDSVDAMPWLQGQLQMPGSGWTSIPNAFTNTPLCCPARASLLTGRYPWHTGVLRNEDGGKLDESSTVATWLHDAGYRTGLFGKYLNRYPFGRMPYVPPGWDRFVAKRNQSGATVYRGFEAVDQGSQVRIDAYATDWFAERAVDFVRTTAPTQPLFLVFAPSAPHEPWLPATRHAGTYAEVPIEEASNVAGALRGAPPWVRSLPVPSAAQRTAWILQRRRADETLLAVDEALRAIVASLGDRLDETFIFVLSDNGYSFGEHRWAGKRCPYEACVRIPMVVHAPSGAIAGEEVLVSIVDLAPTIASLARVPSPSETDGTSLADALDGRGRLLIRSSPVLLGWAGDGQVPAWTAVRTQTVKLIRYEDGVEELYDIGGRIGRPDPWETVNRVQDRRYQRLATHLRALLSEIQEGPG